MSTRATITELMKRTFVEMMKDVGTSIPGHILSWEPDRQMAQVQIGIQRVDTEGVGITPAPIIECPVFVYGSNNFSIDIKLEPNDEGMILFSQRCIDSWVDTGGVANNPILRFHDISDACFIPGFRSQPGKIINHNNDGIRLRNKAGDQYVWLKDNGDIESKGATWHHIGEITSTGDMTAGSGSENISLINHDHVINSGSSAPGPTAKPTVS